MLLLLLFFFFLVIITIISSSPRFDIRPNVTNPFFDPSI
jgi:hypothetical protein